MVNLQSEPSARLPNIVLIYGDDHGFGDRSCNDAKAVKTPNVDRLAHEGLRFTSAYASSGFLFDLAADPGETHDLAADHPDKVKELRELLARIRDLGRTP